MNVEVAVIGLGAMGSAACAAVALRGRSTGGFEQFALDHELGSSSGKTRIIRMAYFEDPAYVPLLRRAYEGWHALERRTSSTLLDLYGVLMVGLPDSDAIAGVQRAARAFDIPITALDAHEMQRRFPGCRPRRDEVGILEPHAGVVFPERGNAAHRDVARDAGATLHAHARLVAIDPQPHAVMLHFDDGARVEARSVIVTAGAWTTKLLHDLGIPLRVDRNVQYWYAAPSHRYHAPAFPAYFVDRGERPFYGTPDMGDGLKFAFHGSGTTEHADPDALRRTVDAAEIADASMTLADWLGDLPNEPREAKVCMYTMTPDGHFAIGRHPHDSRVIIACGFSGHGYKFAPAIGELLADLALGNAVTHEAQFLALDRLLPASP
jgi:sarcosine oxidase